MSHKMKMFNILPESNHEEDINPSYSCNGCEPLWLTCIINFSIISIIFIFFLINHVTWANGVKLANIIRLDKLFYEKNKSVDHLNFKHKLVHKK